MTIGEQSAEQPPQEQWEQGIEAYRELLALLRDLPVIRHSTHYALAFLVEDMRRSSGEGWKEVFVAFKSELAHAMEEGGLPQLTGKIQEALLNRYGVYLKDLEMHETDMLRKRNLGLLIRTLDDEKNISEEVCDMGRAMPIGGVILEHVPSWFRGV